MSSSTTLPLVAARPSLDPRLVGALATIYLIWGSTYLAMRVAVESLPPFGQAGLRFVVAGTVLLAIARWRGEAWPRARTWLVALPIGALLFGAGNGLVAAAERTVPSGIAAVVCATTPLIAAGAGALSGERPTRAELGGMMLGLAAVIVLALGSPLGGAGLDGVLIVLAPIGFALGSLWSRAEGRARPGTALGATATQMMLGGATLLAVSALVGEPVPHEIPLRAAVAWLHLVVLGSLVAFTAYAWLLRHARPAVAMSYAYVNPIVAVVLGAVLAGEAISWATAIAGAAIAGGVMWAIRGSVRG
ncbi:EamA family transporter [Sandaracinus amylolyticus]|nr:EamA family transporter [Sandaracinus amylolyticus]